MFVVVSRRTLAQLNSADCIDEWRNCRQQISPRFGTAPWWVSLHIRLGVKSMLPTGESLWAYAILRRLFLVKDAIHKPEVSTVSQRHQRRTELQPQVSCTKIMVKIGRVVPEICMRTYTQADRHAHRWTTLDHGCARSLASGRSHMRVLPPGTLCPTTSAPSLILSSSGNCSNHTILVKLLIFLDFCVCFLCVLSFGWLLQCTYGLGSLDNGRTVNIWHDMMWCRDRNKSALRCRVIIIIIIRYEQTEGQRSIANNWRIKSSVWMLRC